MSDDSRRAFLRRAAIGSGALATGCATLGRPALSAPRATELIARLDEGLARIRAMPPGMIRGQLPWPATSPTFEEDAKQTLEGLVVTDVLREVDRDARVPAAFALRLAEAMPAVDRCVDAFHAKSSPDARGRLDAATRRRPDLPTDVAAWIDDRAAEVGVGPTSRTQLRHAAAEMKIRMRRQSPRAVMDEVAEKVDRLVARRDAPAAIAHRASATALLASIQQGLEVGGVAPGLGRRLDAPRASAPVRLVEAPPLPVPERRRWNERWGSPGDANIRLGAILMPFGLVSCGVMLFVGLGLLIHGVVQNDTWDGTPEPERH